MTEQDELLKEKLPQNIQTLIGEIGEKQVCETDPRGPSQIRSVSPVICQREEVPLAPAAHDSHEDRVNPRRNQNPEVAQSVSLAECLKPSLGPVPLYRLTCSARKWNS